MKKFKVVLAIESEVEVEVLLDDEEIDDDETLERIARETWEEDADGAKFPALIMHVAMVDSAAVEEAPE